MMIGNGQLLQYMRNLLAVFALSFCVASSAYAEVRDRVIAFVDDHAITLSEFQEQYRNTIKVSPNVSEEEVISTMINRALILREAKKYRIEAHSEDEVMREYIDLKVRAFIKIGEEEIEGFFRSNASQFAGREYEDVRGEIEKYLTEKDLNDRLKETLSELRKNAYVKIQLRAQ
ncbi:MAG: SurA N-terminal domain-containing protein [Nitrospirae bacterium]|nr:SurA N-terminal domain-containing protein [Nitrospirota bacterium]